MTVQLAADRLWEVVAAHRAGVADLLAGLTREQWEQPSLCAGWTVRDVAAHLTLQQLGLRDVLGTMLHWRGTMDRTIADAARRRAAAWSTEQIAENIRATAGVRKPTLGVTALETLTDILVHSQDIALPLGLRLDLPPDAAAASATRTLTMRWPVPPPSVRTVRGFELTATDLDWTAGTGPRVSGPIGALLLIICGRTAALPQLSGDGVADLTATLT